MLQLLEVLMIDFSRIPTASAGWKLSRKQVATKWTIFKASFAS